MPRVEQACRVSTASLAPRDLWDLLDQRVTLVLPACLDPRDPLGRLERRVGQVLMADPALRDLPDLRDPRDPRVILVLSVPSALASRVP